MPYLIVIGETETWDRLTINVEVDHATCERCGNNDGLGDPKPWNPVDIADTPSRGKPTTLRLMQYRYRCQSCARTFNGPAPGIDTRRRMTQRLIRYIEDNALRRPRSAIATEVGVSVDQVKALALSLAERLSGHKFPTPRVLGIDDIRMNGKTYTIFTDSERGHAIGLIASAKRAKVEQWIVGHLDRDKVEVVVSDLAKSIASAVAATLEHAVHVVDRWHVLQACQKAMGVIISETLAPLDSEAKRLKDSGVAKANNHPRKQARTIRSLRPDLLGRRRGAATAQEGSLFDEQLLLPVLEDHPKLSRAFWARIDLTRVYHCSAEAEARERIVRFYKAATHIDIGDAMASTVRRLKRHERLILNYFVAIQRFPDIAPAALTTSSTERRNGKLRGSWKAGRGIRNMNYLRMLALYEPWRLDRDILLCGGNRDSSPCLNVEGPVSLVPELTGLNLTKPIPLPSPWRCASCCSPPSGAVQTS